MSCCGPCSIAVFNANWHDYFDEISFYFNGDNFDTAEEYERRRVALKAVMDNFAQTHGPITWINADYSPRVFQTCEECIHHRMLETAQYAAKNGYDCFSTTLTVSPHKRTDLVNGIGRGVAIITGVPFLSANLKKKDGFKRTVEKSRELAVYRQNYCGCARSRAKLDTCK